MYLGVLDDADVRVRLRLLASERRRFGYWRLHILLAREGALFVVLDGLDAKRYR